MKLTRAEQQQVEQARKKVGQMAKKYARRWPSIREDDLVSEGDLVAVTYAPRFDPATGDFDGFIYKRIKGAMYDYARRVLRDPMVEERRVNALTEDVGNSGPAEDMADVMNPNAPTLRQLVVSDLERTAAALLAGLFGGADDVAEDAVVSNIDRARQRRALRTAMEELDEPMRRFVLLHYFEELTLDEVAVRLGVSKRTVQRVNDRAKDWLKAWFAAPASARASDSSER